MRLRAFARALPCLACLALFAPAVAADSPDAILGDVLPEHVAVPSPPDPWGPVDGIDSAPLDELREMLRKMVEINAGPNFDVAYESVDVSIHCDTNAQGKLQCEGYVCIGDDSEGSDPVSTGGDPDKVGAAVDPIQNPDGSYGPYEGAFVSLGGNCGCLKWVQG